MRAEIDWSDNRAVFIDCSAITLMDSSAFQVMVHAIRYAIGHAIGPSSATCCRSARERYASATGTTNSRSIHERDWPDAPKRRSLRGINTSTGTRRYPIGSWVATSHPPRPPGEGGAVRAHDCARTASPTRPQMQYLELNDLGHHALGSHTSHRRVTPTTVRTYTQAIPNAPFSPARATKMCVTCLSASRPCLRRSRQRCAVARRCSGSWCA